MLNTIADIGTILTGLGAAWIVWLGYRLAHRQRADTWLENLNHLHSLFWEDADFKKVREWLASDNAYADLQRSIEARFLHPEDMSTSDYGRIELLDKFFNFLIRVRLVDSQLQSKRDLWEELLFRFWLDEMSERQRWHMLIYFQHFFRMTRLGGIIKSAEQDHGNSDYNEIRHRLLYQSG